MDNQQIIKQRLEILPEDIKEAIKSTDLASKFDLIANKHSLHVDQNGSLQTETLLVMLGIEPTENYVDNIKKELNISRNEAISIAEDINTEIFDSIKNSLQSMQTNEEQITDDSPPPQTPIAPTITPPITDPTPIEKAGRFTIEKPPVGMGSPSQYNEKNLNRENVLKGIEDPEKTETEPVATVVPPEISMIDHLLTTPIKSSEKIETKSEVKTEVKAETPKSYSADPYREQI